MKILVVEDEVELADLIVQSLTKEYFVVEAVNDFYSALDKINNYLYDCILLDIGLPGGSGIEVLEYLRDNAKSENVIIISAKDSLEDKIMGLNLGADDYLTKPFHLAELNARVKAVLRRKELDGKQRLEFGDVSMDLEERKVYVDAYALELNRKEFDILRYFLFNKNRLVSKMSLAEHVWGDNIDQADNLDFVYYQIKNLRKKLKAVDAGIEIESVYGTGYRVKEL
ncbi:MAG TPA: response regulator transcription factor [Candidatus Sphingobacterium stercoripullorum]|uniref:Response regulator transcription factor n=1 Tax=Candidatus Sphingobacterium stercoripullorum TaxID=2838759 RepID=A0A9D2AZE5_9SPHI|nr:response regulator transcription factor [Candidatus Sphingobacterium stercoripullorum]